MIILRPLGGLGNQLFQYAFGRFVARRQRAPLWIDTSWYPRERVGYPADNPNRVLEFEIGAFRIFCQKLVKEVPSGARLTYVQDHGQSANDVAQLGRDLLLEGDWSGRIEHLLDPDFAVLLRRELRVSVKLDDLAFVCNTKLIDAAPNSVAVHVRRGDYTQLQSFFSLLGPEYYEEALTFIQAKVGSLQIFVFSDEIDWVRCNLSFPRGAHFIATRTAIENFELSRRCRHIVAANSTFSWWVAYLMDSYRRDSGLVVMPKSYHSYPAWQAAYEMWPMPAGWIRV